MKITHLIMLSAACAVILGCGDSAKPIDVKGVELPATLNLAPGETAELTAKVLPENATDKSVTWRTENPSIATVNNGKVQGGAVGTAVITVVTNSGRKIAKCTVFVSEAGVIGSGKTGELSWLLTESDGCLSFTGNGPIPDFSNSSPAPWKTFAADIKSVSIDNGVTAIGKRAFAELTALESVSIGARVGFIGDEAFLGCTSLSGVTLREDIALGKDVFKDCPLMPAGPTITSKKVVLAYVISWSNEIPDPTHLTHINYAFGQIKNNGGKWNSVNMASNIADNNPDRLKMIVGLKKQKPSLKVLLSIGGWGCDGFSQMSANDEWRAAFAKDCKRVIDEFGLDGVDLDWESPTTDAQGQIACSPDDTKNFTKLVKEIRARIGSNKLLTIASGSGGEHYDWKEIDPYMDFYNIMSYDMGNPPDHQSALYKFGGGGWGWGDNAVNRHIEGGVPAEKLTLGIPFYGRFSTALKPGDNFVPYREIAAMIARGEYTEKWDDTSKVPYLVDATGKMVCGYDNARSIAIKCQYAKDRGMLGVMYWDYSQDDAAGTLRNATYDGMMNAR